MNVIQENCYQLLNTSQFRNKTRTLQYIILFAYYIIKVSLFNDILSRLCNKAACFFGLQFSAVNALNASASTRFTG